jgi:hypothetical protein
MSHGKEREEKVCLNCGEEPLYDRYCHHCGQQNIEPRQTAWDLLTHFFNDITHFDGKFFSTLKHLLIRPGFLSDEYVKGRRTKYLDPVRMYIFISAVFFIAFLSIVKAPAPPTIKDKPLLDYMDSIRRKKNVDGFSLSMISVSKYDKKATIFNVDRELKHGYAYYDSVQKSLPPAKRDNFLRRAFRRKQIGIYQTYESNPYNFVPNVIVVFLNSISKIFFITLPIFAFILYVMNLRHRRHHYVGHAIFAIHYYCVAFMFLFILLLGLKSAFILTDATYPILVYTVIGGMAVYLLVAMRRFYKQGWFTTFLKFFLLSVSFSLVFILLVVIMFFNSLASVQ